MMRSSFTRGVSTVRVPAPTVTRLACARPLRTTSACPSWPRALRCRSVYASTSASSASASIRCAPSRASRSSADSSFVFPRPHSFSVTLSIGVPFPALAGAVVVGCFQLGKVRHLRQLMAIHNFRSYLAKNKPRPLFITAGGDYKIQRKAKKLTSFVEGVFFENEAYTLGVQAFRDACVLGDGIIHVYADAKGRVRFERVLSS